MLFSGNGYVKKLNSPQKRTTGPMPLEERNPSGGRGDRGELEKPLVNSSISNVPHNPGEVTEPGQGGRRALA